MASKEDLERFHITNLAVQCQQAADNHTLDDITRAKGAALKLEWVQLVQRETPAPPDFKTHEKIQAEKVALKARMVELLVMV